MKTEPYVTYRMFRSKQKLENGNAILDTTGAVTAACCVDPGKKTMKVGFSFLNPNDHQLLVRGRGQAVQRMNKNPVELPVELDKDGHFMVTEAVLNYMLSAAKSDLLESYLKIGKYNGKPEKNKFRLWFVNFVKNIDAK